MRGLSEPPSSGVRQAERAGAEARATGRNLRIHLIEPAQQCQEPRPRRKQER